VFAGHGLCGILVHEMQCGIGSVGIVCFLECLGSVVVYNVWNVIGIKFPLVMVVVIMVGNEDAQCE